MTKKEIEECKFIDERMKFFTLNDFILSKKLIKTLYQKLDNPIFYKWFVYSNIHITLSQKDAIWRWLNGETEFFAYKYKKERNNEYRYGSRNRK